MSNGTTVVVMAPEDRERWILVLLPAIAVTTIYALFFHWSNTNALTAVQKSYDEAKKKEVPFHEMALAKKKLDDVKNEIADLETLHKDLAAKWKEILHRGEASGVQVEHFDRLTEQLGKKNLRIIEAGAVEGGKAVELPPAVQKARERMKKEGSSQDLLVWQVKCVGKYSEVASLLEELADSPEGLIPISIQMEQAAPLAEERTWVIRVMM